MDIIVIIKGGVPMRKTHIYLMKEELDAWRKAAARSGRSVADLVRDAIRRFVVKPKAAGPVALWDGQPRRTSLEHWAIMRLTIRASAQPR